MAAGACRSPMSKSLNVTNPCHSYPPPFEWLEDFEMGRQGGVVWNRRGACKAPFLEGAPLEIRMLFIVCLLRLFDLSRCNSAKGNGAEHLNAVFPFASHARHALARLCQKSFRDQKSCRGSAVRVESKGDPHALEAPWGILTQSLASAATIIGRSLPFQRRGSGGGWEVLELGFGKPS